MYFLQHCAVSMLEEGWFLSSLKTLCRPWQWDRKNKGSKFRSLSSIMSKLEMAKKSIDKYFFMSDFFTFADGFFAISNFASIDEIPLGCFGGTRIYPTWHFGQMQGCIRSSWELRRSKLPWNCNFLRKMLTEAMPVKVMQICVYLHLLFCQIPIAECLRLLPSIFWWDLTMIFSRIHVLDL